MYGCDQVPKVGLREDIEIPAAYWGQEAKSCPTCGAAILAAALRCRHCGMTFESARPETTGEYRKRRAAADLQSGLRRRIVWIFVACMIPLLAPLAVLFAVPWYLINRRRIWAMPPLYAALAMLGVGLGIGQSALVLGALLVYMLFRSTPS